MIAMMVGYLSWKPALGILQHIVYEQVIIILVTTITNSV